MLRKQLLEAVEQEMKETKSDLNYCAKDCSTYTAIDLVRKRQHRLQVIKNALDAGVHANYLVALMIGDL